MRERFKEIFVIFFLKLDYIKKLDYICKQLKKQSYESTI